MSSHINRRFFAIVSVLLIVPPADAVTIDFDSLPGMVNVPGQPVPLSSQLSDALILTDGVSFGSATTYVAVTQHAPAPTVSPPNVIGGATANGLLSYGTPIEIAFFDPTNPTTEVTVDYVSIRGDRAPLPDATANMEAFNIFGDSLGSISASDSDIGLTLCLNVPGIHFVRLTQNSDGAGIDGTIGFDNLSFNRPVLDTDSDGIPDATDNCVDVPNMAQRDTDGDGFGNHCDADLNSDCIVNVTDLGVLRVRFFTNDPDADFNDDGIVNVVDLGIMRTLFFEAPGPASLPNDCNRCVNNGP